MGYFPNMTAWECWATDNCAKCAHWPQKDDDPACPVEMAHMLYNYELCNDTESPGAVILDMLIPRKKGDIDNAKCALFQPRNGVTEKHLKDWEKYKAIMAETERQINRDVAAKQTQRAKDNPPVFVDPRDPRFVVGGAA